MPFVSSAPVSSSPETPTEVGWQVKRYASPDEGAKIFVSSFDEIDTRDVGVFPMYGRDYNAVSQGTRSGIRARMTIRVMSSTEDEEIMTLLAAGEDLLFHSSWGVSWVARVVGNIDRQLLTTGGASTDTYRIRHRYLLSFEIAEVRLLP